MSIDPSKDKKTTEPIEGQGSKPGDSQAAKVEQGAHAAGLKEAQEPGALNIIKSQSDKTGSPHVPGLTLVDDGKGVKPGEKSEGVMSYVNAAVAKGTEAVSVVIGEAEKGIKAIGKAVGIGGEPVTDGKKAEVAAAQSGDRPNAADNAPAAGASDRVPAAGTAKAPTDIVRAAVPAAVTGDGQITRDTVMFRGPITDQAVSVTERLQTADLTDAALKGLTAKPAGETPRMVAPPEAPKPPASAEAPSPTAAVEAPRPTASVEAPRPAATVDVPRPAATVDVPRPNTADAPSPVVANLEAIQMPQANSGDAPLAVPPARPVAPVEAPPAAVKDETAATPGEPEKEKSYLDHAKDLAGKVADVAVSAANLATDAAVNLAKTVKEFVAGPDDIKFGDEKYSKSGDKWKGPDGKLYNDVSFDKDAKKLVLKAVDGSVEEHLQSGEKIITSKDGNDRSNVVRLDANGKPTEVTTDGQKLQFDPNTQKWTDDTGRAVNDVTYNAANGDVSINWNGTTIQTVSRSGESNVIDAQREFSARYDAKGNLSEVQDKSGTYKVTEDPAKSGQPLWKDGDGNTLSQVSIHAKTGEMSIIKNDTESVKVSADGVREQVSPSGTVVTSRDGSNNEISVKLGVDGKPTEMVTQSGTYVFDASKNQWSKDTIPIAGAEFNRATGEITIRKDADNTITTKLNGEVTTLNRAAGNLKTEFDAKGEVKAISSDYIGSLTRQQDPLDSTRTTFVDDKGRSGYKVQKGLLDSVDITKPNGDRAFVMPNGLRGEMTADGAQSRWFDKNNQLTQVRDGVDSYLIDRTDPAKPQVMHQSDGAAVTNIPILDANASAADKANYPYATLDKATGALTIHDNANSSYTKNADFSTISRISDGSASTTVLSDKIGNIVSIETSKTVDGHTISVTTDANFRVLSATLPDGSKVDYALGDSAHDHIYLKTSPDGKVESIGGVTYDFNAGLKYSDSKANLQTINADGTRVENDVTQGRIKTFSASGDMTSMVDTKDGFTYTFKYDADRNLTEVTNRAGVWQVVPGTTDPVTGEAKWLRTASVADKASADGTFAVTPFKEPSFVWEGKNSTSDGEYNFVKKSSDAVRPIMDGQNKQVGTLYVGQNGAQYRVIGTGDNIRSMEISKDNGRTFVAVDLTNKSVKLDSNTKLPIITEQTADGKLVGTQTYDAKGGIISRDENNNIVRTVDARGNGYEYFRDEKTGEIMGANSLKNGVTNIALGGIGDKYGIDATSKMPVVIHPDKSTTSFDGRGGEIVRDADGLTTGVKQPDGTLTTYAYDGSTVKSSLTKYSNSDITKEQFFTPSGTVTVVRDSTGVASVSSDVPGAVAFDVQPGQTVKTNSMGHVVIESANGDQRTVFGTGASQYLDKASGAVSLFNIKGELVNTTVPPPLGTYGTRPGAPSGDGVVAPALPPRAPSTDNPRQPSEAPRPLEPGKAPVEPGKSPLEPAKPPSSEPAKNLPPVNDLNQGALDKGKAVQVNNNDAAALDQLLSGVVRREAAAAAAAATAAAAAAAAAKPEAPRAPDPPSAPRPAEVVNPTRTVEAAPAPRSDTSPPAAPLASQPATNLTRSVESPPAAKDPAAAPRSEQVTPKTDTVNTPKLEQVNAPKVEAVNTPKLEQVNAPKLESVNPPKQVESAPAPSAPRVDAAPARSDAPAPGTAPRPAETGAPARVTETAPAKSDVGAAAQAAATAQAGKTTEQAAAQAAATAQAGKTTEQAAAQAAATAQAGKTTEQAAAQAAATAQTGKTTEQAAAQAAATAQTGKTTEQAAAQAGQSSPVLAKTGDGPASPAKALESAPGGNANAIPVVVKDAAAPASNALSKGDAAAAAAAAAVVIAAGRIADPASAAPRPNAPSSAETLARENSKANQDAAAAHASKAGEASALPIANQSNANQNANPANTAVPKGTEAAPAAAVKATDVVPAAPVTKLDAANTTQARDIVTTTAPAAGLPASGGNSGQTGGTAGGTGPVNQPGTQSGTGPANHSGTQSGTGPANQSTNAAGSQANAQGGNQGANLPGGNAQGNQPNSGTPGPQPNAQAGATGNNANTSTTGQPNAANNTGGSLNQQGSAGAVATPVQAGHSATGAQTGTPSGAQQGAGNQAGNAAGTQAGANTPQTSNAGGQTPTANPTGQTAGQNAQSSPSGSAAGQSAGTQPVNANSGSQNAGAQPVNASSGSQYAGTQNQQGSGSATASPVSPGGQSTTNASGQANNVGGANPAGSNANNAGSNTSTTGQSNTPVTGHQGTQTANNANTPNAGQPTTVTPSTGNQSQQGAGTATASPVATGGNTTGSTTAQTGHASAAVGTPAGSNAAQGGAAAGATNNGATTPDPTGHAGNVSGTTGTPSSNTTSGSNIGSGTNQTGQNQQGSAGSVASSVLPGGHSNTGATTGQNTGVTAGQGAGANAGQLGGNAGTAATPTGANVSNTGSTNAPVGAGNTTTTGTTAQNASDPSGHTANGASNATTGSGTVAHQASNSATGANATTAGQTGQSQQGSLGTAASPVVPGANAGAGTNAGQGAGTNAGQGAGTNAGQGAGTNAGQGAGANAGQGAGTNAGQGAGTNAGQGTATGPANSTGTSQSGNNPAGQTGTTTGTTSGTPSGSTSGAIGNQPSNSTAGANTPSGNTQSGQNQQGSAGSAASPVVPGANAGAGANAGQGAGANAGQGAGTNAGQGAGTNAGQGAGANAGQGAGTNAGLGAGANAGQGTATGPANSTGTSQSGNNPVGQTGTTPSTTSGTPSGSTSGAIGNQPSNSTAGANTPSGNTQSGQNQQGSAGSAASPVVPGANAGAGANAGQGAGTNAGQGAGTNAGQGAGTNAGQGAGTNAGQGAGANAGQGIATGPATSTGTSQSVNNPAGQTGTTTGTTSGTPSGSTSGAIGNQPSNSTAGANTPSGNTQSGQNQQGSAGSAASPVVPGANAGQGAATGASQGNSTGAATSHTGNDISSNAGTTSGTTSGTSSGSTSGAIGNQPSNGTTGANTPSGNTQSGQNQQGSAGTAASPVVPGANAGQGTGANAGQGTGANAGPGTGANAGQGTGANAGQGTGTNAGQGTGANAGQGTANGPATSSGTSQSGNNPAGQTGTTTGTTSGTPSGSTSGAIGNQPSNSTAGANTPSGNTQSGQNQQGSAGSAASPVLPGANTGTGANAAQGSGTNAGQGTGTNVGQGTATGPATSTGHASSPTGTSQSGNAASPVLPAGHAGNASGTGTVQGTGTNVGQGTGTNAGQGTVTGPASSTSNATSPTGTSQSGNDPAGHTGTTTGTAPGTSSGSTSGAIGNQPSNGTAGANTPSGSIQSGPNQQGSSGNAASPVLPGGHTGSAAGTGQGTGANASQGTGTNAVQGTGTNAGQAAGANSSQGTVTNAGPAAGNVASTGGAVGQSGSPAAQQSGTAGQQSITVGPHAGNASHSSVSAGAGQVSSTPANNPTVQIGSNTGAVNAPSGAGTVQQHAPQTSPTSSTTASISNTTNAPAGSTAAATSTSNSSAPAPSSSIVNAPSNQSSNIPSSGHSSTTSPASVPSGGIGNNQSGGMGAGAAGGSTTSNASVPSGNSAIAPQGAAPASSASNSTVSNASVNTSGAQTTANGSADPGAAKYASMINNTSANVDPGVANNTLVPDPGAANSSVVPDPSATTGGALILPDPSQSVSTQDPDQTVDPSNSATSTASTAAQPAAPDGTSFPSAVNPTKFDGQSIANFGSGIGEVTKESKFDGQSIANFGSGIGEVIKESKFDGQSMANFGSGIGEVLKESPGVGAADTLIKTDKRPSAAVPDPGAANSSVVPDPSATTGGALILPDPSQSVSTQDPDQTVDPSNSATSTASTAAQPAAPDGTSFPSAVNPTKFDGQSIANFASGIGEVIKESPGVVAADTPIKTDTTPSPAPSNIDNLMPPSKEQLANGILKTILSEAPAPNVAPVVNVPPVGGYSEPVLQSFDPLILDQIITSSTSTPAKSEYPVAPDRVVTEPIPVVIDPVPVVQVPDTTIDANQDALDALFLEQNRIAERQRALDELAALQQQMGYGQAPQVEASTNPDGWGTRSVDSATYFGPLDDYIAASYSDWMDQGKSSYDGVSSFGTPYQDVISNWTTNSSFGQPVNDSGLPAPDAMSVIYDDLNNPDSYSVLPPKSDILSGAQGDNLITSYADQSDGLSDSHSVKTEPTETNFISDKTGGATVASTEGLPVETNQLPNWLDQSMANLGASGLIVEPPKATKQQESIDMAPPASVLPDSERLDTEALKGLKSDLQSYDEKEARWQEVQELQQRLADAINSFAEATRNQVSDVTAQGIDFGADVRQNTEQVLQDINQMAEEEARLIRENERERLEEEKARRSDDAKEQAERLTAQQSEHKKHQEEREVHLTEEKERKLAQEMATILAVRQQSEAEARARDLRLRQEREVLQEMIRKDNLQEKYVVRPNEDLYMIAVRKFKDPHVADLIYELNKTKVEVRWTNGKRSYYVQPGAVVLLPSPRQSREWLARQMTIVGKVPPRPGMSGTTSVDADERRNNIERVLGKIKEASNQNEKTYAVRLGDTLRSVAMKHPDLRDVTLWKLLAAKNGLTPEMDSKGSPLSILIRGTILNIPTAEEISAYRAEHSPIKATNKEPYSFPSHAILDLATKPCGGCDRLLSQSATICPACGFAFNVLPEASVESQSTTFNIPKGTPTLSLDDDEPRTVVTTQQSDTTVVDMDKTTLSLPEAGRKVNTNDGLMRIDSEFEEVDGSRTIEAFSQTCRLVRVEVQARGRRIVRQQLELITGDAWIPVLAYEVGNDCSTRHEYSRDGRRKSISIDLPSVAVGQMVQNELSQNWEKYCERFLSGRKLSV